MTSRPVIVLFATCLTLLAGCADPWPTPTTTSEASQPGWTGRTQIIGNNSTVASNSDATYLQQKWGIGRQR